MATRNVLFGRQENREKEKEKVNGEEAEARVNLGPLEKTEKKRKRKEKALFFLGGQTDQIIEVEKTLREKERCTSNFFGRRMVKGAERA